LSLLNQFIVVAITLKIVLKYNRIIYKIKKMNTDSLKNDSKLEYLNSFAAVFEDAILAHKYNPHTPIQIEYIKKIMLSKKRVLTLNWISFILGFSLLITWFLAKPFSQMVTFLLLTFSLTLITISFIIKKHKYKFIIINFNTIRKK
jgi:hypothetical protein